MDRRSIPGLGWCLWALALLGTTLIVLAAAADARASELKYPSKTKAVPSTLPRQNGRGVAEAACPDSHPHLTGGGVRITGDNSNFDLEVGSTNPETGVGSDKWLGEANNSSGSAAQMTTTAICAKGRFRYPDGSKSIPPGDQASKRVHCPSGTKVIGGGVSTEGDSPKVEVASTEPFDGSDANSTPDDGWLGSANNGTKSGKTMNVTAICAKTGHYKYFHSATRPLPENSTVSASAGCPLGTAVTGGGVDNSGIDIGAEIQSTFPFPDEDWLGSANNDNTGQAETMQTFAICKVTETDFIGTFSEDGTVTFALTHNRTKVHHWAWVHLPVQCREGPDVNSSHYRIDVSVANHHFHAQGVKSPEGFKTTLDGTLTDHDSQAHGTLSMTGPEPPNHTHCHGTGHWTAHGL